MPVRAKERRHAARSFGPRLAETVTRERRTDDGRLHKAKSRARPGERIPTRFEIRQKECCSGERAEAKRRFEGTERKGTSRAESREREGAQG
eukprot:4922509-Pleurochrysis_carterae.AAC.1